MSNYIQSIDFSDKDALPTGNPAKLARGADIDTELALIAAAIATKEDTANKGASNGYAGLDSSGDVPRAQLPTAVAYEDEANVFTSGDLRVSSISPFIALRETDAASNEQYWTLHAGDTVSGQLTLALRTDAFGGAVTAIAIDRTGTTVDSIGLNATALTWNGNTLFSTANDGPGSNLDADLLDNQQGSFYTNAGNLNAGTLPDARVASSNVTQHQAALAINTDQLTTDLADDASTSFTVGSGDAESIRRFTSGSAITITLPNSTPSGWSVGDSMGFIRGGAGTLTFSSSGTIRSPGGSAITVTNGKAVATLHSSGVWELSGNV